MFNKDSSYRESPLGALKVATQLRRTSFYWPSEVFITLKGFKARNGSWQLGEW